MKRFNKKLAKGFTLIELMIVVAIIGILAAIAIPNFIRYQLRSKTAEARTNMGGIKTNQEAFRSTEDNYANVTTDTPAVAGVGTVKMVWTDSTCTGCNRTTTSTSCQFFNCIGFAPSGNVYYSYVSPHQPAAGTQVAEYCISAIGDLDGDTNRGEFEYGSANTVGQTTAFNCTQTICANMEPGSVTDCKAGVF